jgi:hypothetical protein
MKFVSCGRAVLGRHRCCAILLVWISNVQPLEVKWCPTMSWCSSTPQILMIRHQCWTAPSSRLLVNLRVGLLDQSHNLRNDSWRSGAGWPLICLDISSNELVVINHVAVESFAGCPFDSRAVPFFAGFEIHFVRLILDVCGVIGCEVVWR